MKGLMQRQEFILFLGTFVEVLLCSTLRMIPNILRGGNPGIDPFDVISAI